MGLSDSYLTRKPESGDPHNSYRAMYVNLMSYTILTLVIDTWYMSIHDPNPFQTFSNRQQYDGSHVINHGFLVATTWVTNWDWSVCTPPVPPLRWHRKWPEENWTEDLGNPQPEVFRPCWVGFPILVRLPFGGWLIGCKNCLGGWKQLHFLGGEVSVDWQRKHILPQNQCPCKVAATFLVFLQHRVWVSDTNYVWKTWESCQDIIHCRLIREWS